MSHETGPDVSEHAVVSLNGVRYPCLPDVGYQSLATWERKVVSGDYTRDSDPYLSSRIWTDFTGGLGVENFREGSDEGRYAIGTLLVDSPFQAALPRKVETVSAATYPLGDLANVFYMASDTEVFPWDETNDVLGTALTGTLSDLPVYKGFAWNGNQYIPQGANGYQTHNGTAIAAQVTTVQAKGFAEWDNRLFALCADGTLKSYDGATWVTEATLNTSVTPQRLVVYMNATGDDTLYVVTDRMLYAWDGVTQILIPTRLKFPPHPDNGLGAVPWRPGEDLHVFCGLGRYQYNVSSTLANGPDRQAGLAAVAPTLRGRIVDADASHNEVLALVEGLATNAVTPAAEFDPGMNVEDDMSLEVTTAVSAVLGWTGFGWHVRWISDAAITPTWVVVSGAAGAYRVWWGEETNDRLFTMALSRSFSNPAALLTVGEGSWEASGYLDTGWYDAGMRNFHKRASHVEVNMESATATENVTVEYRVDWDAGWTVLGTATTTGQTILPFGVASVDAGAGQFAYGIQFHRIRFRLSFARGSDSTETPILDSLAFEFVKVPKSGETAVITIPLDGYVEWEGRTPAQIKDDLDDLLVGETFVRYQSGSTSMRVALAAVMGRNVAGVDHGGERTVRLIRAPLPNFEG